MTKSTGEIVTWDALCLVIDIFPDEAGKKQFFNTTSRWIYLFSVVHGNRYLPRDSKENVLSITITITGNVSVIPVLDFS